MSETLNYAPASLGRRWSRMAITSLTLGLAAAPLFFLILTIGSHLPLPEPLMLMGFFAAFLLPPAAGLILGATSTIRGITSDGLLKGWWMGLLAVLASIAWPVYAIWFALRHLPVC